MSNAKSSFIYVIFIRTTPKKLWAALTRPEFIKQYWFGMNIETDWKEGSKWKLVHGDGHTLDAGKVVEFDPPRRMVLTWKHEHWAEMADEPPARCAIELEPKDGAVKLTITHTMNRPNSKLIKAVSGGWPSIMSNLKSLLETGKIAMKDW